MGLAQRSDMCFVHEDVSKLRAWPFEGGELFYMFDTAFPPSLRAHIEGLLRRTKTLRRVATATPGPIRCVRMFIH
jgi:hypothetical protein